MRRLLACGWDAQEARVVVTRVAGRNIELEGVFCVPLGAGAEEAATIGERLATAMRERGHGRCEVLVAVQRGKVELRMMQTPAAPDEELPDMVRFQAVRQFAGMDEAWPLDFFRLASGDPAQPRVLAAAVPPKLVEEVRTVCEAALGAPKRLVLRPCASASLLQHRQPDPRCRLLVELLGDEAELTVVDRGQAVFLRSVRLPGQDLAAWLVGEIRRTVAAAQNQLEGRQVEAVVLCGDAAEHAEAMAALKGQLTQPVELFDPFAGLALERWGRDPRPDHPGRYAALLGMLEDEVVGRPHAIDFLNPRRRPPPPKRGIRYALVGAAAALVLLVLGGMLWSRLSYYDKQIQGKREESKERDAAVKIARKLQADVAEIDKWVVGDVNWLDELHDLSERFPPPEKAIVEQTSFLASVQGGQMEVDGFVRETDVIQDMENALRGDRHVVTGTGGQRDDRQDRLKWRFKERITVTAAAPKEVESHE